MQRGQLELTLQAVFGAAVVVEVLFDGTDAEMNGVVLPGERAIEAWMRLRRIVEVIGAWPVVIGPRVALNDQAQNLGARTRSIREILDAAGDVDPDPREWRERSPAVRGSWPDVADEDAGFCIPCDPLSLDPHPEVIIALVRTEVAWTLPAHLNLTGAGGLSPEQHCAAWKQWGDQFGAEPVGIGGGMVEFLVTRPPATVEMALDLADAMHAYCPAPVDQGTGTLAPLAAQLLGARTWTVWWD